jgi:plastocyanin
VAQPVLRIETIEKYVFPYTMSRLLPAGLRGIFPPFPSLGDFIMKWTTLVAFLTTAFVPAMAQAQDWADVTIKFVLDGDIPKLAPLNAAADPVCAAQSIPNERLVVDEKSKAIANVVFMVDAKQTKLPADKIHPSLKDVPDVKPVLDNVKCQFVPHILPIRAGQTVEVKNSDSTGHNAKFVFFNNEEWNQVIPTNGTKQIQIKKAESGPSKVECNIHPWMTAYHVVTDHPYVGVSDANGVVKIEKLPAGVELTFKLWHEAQNKFDEVTVNGKADSWKKGNVKFTLKPGENDLGTVTIKPDKFKP